MVKAGMVDKLGKKRFDVGPPHITVDETRIIPAEKLRNKFEARENKVHEETWINEHYIKERLKALGIVE